MARGRSAFDAIQRAISKLERLGDTQAMADLAEKLGDEELRLIDQSLATSTDCYGKPMPPRVDDGAAPLQGLRGTFDASFDANGVRVTSSKWYAGVHNSGAHIAARNATYLKFRLPSGAFASKKEVDIPKRQFAPTRTYGLGTIWGPALLRVMSTFMRERVG
jgi:hypothetical protein